MKRLTIRVLGSAAGILVTLFAISCSAPQDSEHVEEEGLVEVDGERLEQEVQLFFPTSEGRLRAETRTIQPQNNTQSAHLEALVEALLLGPENPALIPLFEVGVEVDTAYFSDENLAWILLISPTPAPEPSGARWEMARLYSLVNSVQQNLPKSQGVLFLWNGRQPETFAGHIDTTRPLRADLSLIESP